MKKTFIFLMLALLLCFGAYAAAPETTEPTLYIESVQVVGNTATVNVGIVNNPGAIYVHFRIGYDDTYCTLEQYQSVGNIFPGFNADLNYAANPIMVNYDNSLSYTNYTGDGIIGTVTFTLEEGFTETDVYFAGYTVAGGGSDIYYNEFVAWNEAGDDMDEFSVNVSNGSITRVTAQPHISTFGAAVRFSEPTGIRFGTSIAKDDFYFTFYTLSKYVYDAELNIKFGTLIIPTSYLAGDPLTHATDDVLDIVAENIYSETTDTLTFTGVLYDIPTSEFTTSLTARGYVMYKLPGDSEYSYWYAQPIERTYVQVAQAALEDETDAGKISALQAIIDAAN